MKINCDVIRDLLPLYAENMLSEKSRQLVDEHLHDCENCKKTLAEMKKPEIQITHNIDPIKKFKHGFRKHTITVASLTAFITVAIIILIWGIFFLQPGDELGYTILCFYFFLPLTAFICSWILGTRPNKIKWFVPFIFGCIGGILPYAIYRSMDMIFVFFAFIPSIFGLLIGTIIYAIKARRRN
jgi:putative zinc finger protein